MTLVGVAPGPASHDYGIDPAIRRVTLKDGEWPALKACFARWLDEGNFDAAGRQRLRLSELTAACRPAES